MNCRECYRSGKRPYCDVRKLLHQLHVPPQEQVILMNMANRKKMNCESFKNVLLLLLQGKSVCME
jgi:hypothetical protein